MMMMMIDGLLCFVVCQSLYFSTSMESMFFFFLADVFSVDQCWLSVSVCCCGFCGEY